MNGYFANEGALSGQVDVRACRHRRADAQIASAASDLDARRRPSSAAASAWPSGAVSGDELTQAENQFRTRPGGLPRRQARAREPRRWPIAPRLSGTGRQHRPVSSGATGRRQSRGRRRPRQASRKPQLDFDRTTLRAPFDGVVAKKNVALGEQVQVGQPLMSVVPISTVYVDANFKEVQLRRVRAGPAGRR